MKTIWICSVVCMAAIAATADDIKVRLTGGELSGTFPVTTNETSCGRLNWDGPPDKTGGMSGGRYEITVQLTNETVVLKELTLAFHDGISSDVVARTIVPTNKIPWTGTISQTTVVVFRAEQKLEEAKSPQAPQAAVAPASGAEHK